ncbi:MAG: hypothetical protein EXR79_01250 [Myxococcales bacterium]|nr:hypothetical protein [Myxococcales bacterium]
MLRDSDGNALALAAEVGRGGEGGVYDVVGRPGAVAKVYAHPPRPDKVEKLSLMASLFGAHPELAWWCAWPEVLIRDDGGQCLGFLMRKLEGQQPVHDIYSPERRKALLPDVGWEFLVRTATNVARMFASLHGLRVIVGDVNERNLFVGRDATVTFVDCDSFQIATATHVFVSGVGVPDYTPPELQGEDFRTAIRSEAHDRFGLAVILFKLLFMGRHPFSGGASGELGPAIRDRAFDYPQLQRRLPHLVPLEVAGADLAGLFGAAFAGPPEARPEPGAWAEALDELERSLQACPVDPLHRVPAHLDRCPWCQIEGALRYSYFAPAAQGPAESRFRVDLDRLADLLGALDSVAAPIAPDQWVGPASLDKALRALDRALAEGERPEAAVWYLRAGGIGLAALGTALLLAGGDGARLVVAAGVGAWLAGGALATWRRRPFRRACARWRTERDELGRAGEDWRGDAVRARQFDRQTRQHALELGAAWRDLERRQREELERMRGDRVTPAWIPVLQQTAVEGSLIPGLPPDRRQGLLVRGLLTAADLNRTTLAQVPGLTGAHIDAVIAWRQSIELQVGAPRRLPPSRAQHAALDANLHHLQENLAHEIEAVTLQCAHDARTADTALQAAWHAIESRAAATLTEAARRDRP